MLTEKQRSYLAEMTPKTSALQIERPRVYTPGTTIEEVQHLFGIHDILKLGSNENTLGPSPLALQAIQQALQIGLLNLAHYSDPLASTLKEKLSQRYHCTPDQFIIGNGSDEILSMIYRAFIHGRPDGNGKSEVILSQYGFSAFTVLAENHQIPITYVPEKNFRLDLQRMLQSLTENTRAIFIANPNNPTGTWVTKQELSQFLSQVPRNILVVIDEAYAEYLDHPDYPNTIDWLAKYPNVIVTRTFSKAYGLAGLRVGFAVTTRDTALLMNRVKQPFNVNTLGQLAAAAALDDIPHLEKTRANIKRGLRQWQQALHILQLSHIPSSCNFITIDVKQDTDAIFQAMLAEGVIVRPLKPYCMPHHLRITIGTEPENRRAIAALKKALS